MTTSVGELLRKARQDKRFALTDVSKFTHIHPRFLQALEDGNYEIFSSPVHLQGFLKNYAVFLGLSPERILASYRREHVFSQENSKKNETRLSFFHRFWPPSKKQIGFFSFSCLCLIFLIFLFIRYQLYAGTPVIQVARPVVGEIVTQEQLLIEGSVSSSANLSLNDQPLTVNEDGTFSLTVNLLEGRNTFHLVAVNKIFGKKATTDLLVFYKP